MILTYLSLSLFDSFILLLLQDFQWDLSGKPLSPDDVLSIQVKDYEKVLMKK